MKLINNKYIKILFALICIFLVNDKVNAETYTCKYTISDGNFKYQELNVVYATDDFEVLTNSSLYYTFPDEGNLWHVEKEEEEDAQSSLFNTARMKVYNLIPLSTWENNGCLQNIYVAYNTSYMGYAFTTHSDLASVGISEMDAIAKATLSTSNNTESGYTLTFITNAGGVYEKQTMKVDAGTVITAPSNPSVDGYEFVCWNVTSECFDFSTPINSDTQFFAHFEEIEDYDENKAGFKNDIDKKYVNCNGVDLPYGVPYIVHNIINLLQILTPIVLIVLGMIDFGKAVVASDEKQMKESSSKFIRRALAAAIIFFVIAIVKFVFGTVLSNNNGALGCIGCFISDNCGEAYYLNDDSTSNDSTNDAELGETTSHQSESGTSHGGGGKSR